MERPEALPQRQAAFDAAWAALPAHAHASLQLPLLDEYSLLENARHSALATSPEGERWILFPATATGMAVDLWAARVLPEGPERAVLLGATAFRPVYLVKVHPLLREGSRARARLAGAILTVTYADGDAGKE